MAAEASATMLSNGTHDSNKPIQLSVGLPQSPGMRVYIHLSILATNIVLFLTSAAMDGGQSGAAMGSFVYAMPDRYNHARPMSTPLYSSSTSLDYATRMAKLLARRTKKMCYVGSSVNLPGAAGGGSIEEEMEALRAVADVVFAEIAKATQYEDGH